MDTTMAGCTTKWFVGTRSRNLMEVMMQEMMIVAAVAAVA
jgi:hypothetical protein